MIKLPAPDRMGQEGIGGGAVVGPERKLAWGSVDNGGVGGRTAERQRDGWVFAKWTQEHSFPEIDKGKG